MTEKISNVELNDLSTDKSSKKNVLEKDYSLIKDVEVSLTALIGEAKISVNELFSLKKGSVVSLQTKLNETAYLYLKEKLVAKGNIVAVEDSYGIEITEIL